MDNSRKKEPFSTFSFVFLLISFCDQVANAVITTDRRVRICAKIKENRLEHLSKFVSFFPDHEI